MHDSYFPLRSCLTVLFTLVSVACSSSPDVQETYTPATDLYSQPMDESAILQDEQTGMIFAGDQVLVLTKTAFAGNEVLEAIATEQEIEWVGAIPDLGLYQFRTPPLDIPTQEALLDRIRQYASVEGAFPNYLISTNAQKATCREFGDNHVNVDGTENVYNGNENVVINPRCGFLDTSYYDILPIFRSLHPWFSFGKVKVAIIDMEFLGLKGQFNRIKYTKLSRLPFSFYERSDSVPNRETPEGHGFTVTGIVAADDNGTSTAGLLTEPIGAANVHLYIGAVDTKKVFNKSTYKWKIVIDYYHIIELSVRAARDAKADIINMSFSQYCIPLTSFNCLSVNSSWRRLFSTYYNTLFVAAAGNESFSLQGDELFPSSMTNVDNLIKVGGNNYCAPGSLHPLSNYSELPGVLDIAAPFAIPVLNPSDLGSTWITGQGTSISTPMVSALAGLLKSIQPELTPVELKEAIIFHAKEGPVYMGGAALDFSKPILHVLSQKTGLAPEVVKLIARDGTADPVSIILNRICGDCLFTIDGEAPIRIQSDDSLINIQEGQNRVFSMYLFDKDETFTFVMNNQNSFVLHETIPVFSDFSVSLTTSDDIFTGSGIDGSLYFYTCMVTARNPMTTEPLMIEVDGYFSGKVGWVPLLTGIEESKGTSVAFTLSARVSDDGSSPFPLYEYIENNCILGYAP